MDHNIHTRCIQLSLEPQSLTHLLLNSFLVFTFRNMDIHILKMDLGIPLGFSSHHFSAGMSVPLGMCKPLEMADSFSKTNTHKRFITSPPHQNHAEAITILAFIGQISSPLPSAQHGSAETGLQLSTHMHRAQVAASSLKSNYST